MTSPEPRGRRRAGRGLAGRVAQRQLLAGAQPRLQALGVGGQLDPRDAARLARRAGIRDARIALDEERQPGLGHRLRDAGQSCGQAVALDARHLEAQALGPRRARRRRRPPSREAVGRGGHGAAHGGAAASSWSAIAMTSR
jgi:hypothetical protein